MSVFLRINDPFSHVNARACALVEVVGNWANSIPVLSMVTSPLRFLVGTIQLAVNGIFSLIAKIGLCHHARLGNSESGVWKERVAVAGGLTMAGAGLMIASVCESVIAWITLGIANYYIAKTVEALLPGEGRNKAYITQTGLELEEI
jgi:hypothetical protein